ncbi:MAG: succinate dehydrogenase assembly factor 2 [Gammaproteobacteria bacterium]|nr:succinate dehydrogenase assembly factor 2 [Gammaproteobacteria bacterium]
MGAMDEAHERARLHWQCRRGMRELDLLLQAYLDHAYDGAADAERAAFRRLLDTRTSCCWNIFSGLAAERSGGLRCHRQDTPRRCGLTCAARAGSRFTWAQRMPGRWRSYRFCRSGT